MITERQILYWSCLLPFLQVKVTQELKNTHMEQMTRLHFKHQTECDLLEDMRYEDTHPSTVLIHSPHPRFLSSKLEPFKRSLAGGGQREGTSCCLLPLSFFLMWFHYFLSLVSHFILCLWPSSHHCSCVSCSFGLWSVYSGRVWVRQISILALAVVGNPDSSTVSYSLCWMITDY